MFEFAFPMALWLLPLPLAIYLLSPAYRDRSEALRTPFFQRLISASGRQPATGAAIITKGLFQRLIISLIWLLIVAALAQPQWAMDPIVRDTAARDLLLVVDLSGSMEAEDFTDADGNTVTRLDAVKQVVDEFVERRESDRLGLAVFGTAAFPQAPFTEDREVVSALLAELQPRMAGPQTMLGDAIGLAVRLFENSEMQRKVVILLTDGNDTGSKMPVARAAGIAADNDIVIHTIAMGDPATVGEKALDIPALQEISTLTDGEFFLALDRTELEGIYTELDALEPAETETVSYRPKRSLFHWPLGTALLLQLILSLYMVRAPEVRHA